MCRAEQDHLASSRASYEGSELAGNGGPTDVLEQLQALPLAAPVHLLLSRQRHKVLQVVVHLQDTRMRAAVGSQHFGWHRRAPGRLRLSILCFSSTDVELGRLRARVVLQHKSLAVLQTGSALPHMLQ